MVFKVLFLLGILLAIGRASEDYQKCIDNCTQTLEDKVTEELEDCKGRCQGPVAYPFGLQSMLNGFLSDDIFRDVDDSHRHGGLTISFGVPSSENEEWGMPKWVHQHVGQMMKQMNRQMGQIMQSMKTGMSDMISVNNGGGGGGKMYVMKSGPGYHEEKTYDIGPNGEMTLIQNDQMNKVNQLEKNAGVNEDVEIFDPEMLMREFDQIADETNEGENWIQDMEDKQLAKHTIISNDFEEGPKLPETGLRSRTIPADKDLCRMEGLQWSEWSKCLHLNMGMPKWLVISSLSLGIIFLIWLCLVIPSNPPKQRIKKPAINTKEAEAFTIVTEKQHPPVYQANDLPPPYEDVAKVKVALEPEITTKNNEA